ncbi:MAG TPA: tetratricopeptide repeat protein [Fimbriimonadaceae bacterium]|nr:tetratricopeptide repeat protein [Fimbriimonadaceae bacterium]
MAAPANNKCEKCFTSLPPGAATCPECGAPVGNVSPAEAEADVYPELAKANLARMRGDYKQAEDQLLSVLKRYPNNPSANEMLGDLAAEREDYPHAVEWYEMALEIVPTSASIGRKLRDARSKVEQKQTQDTTAQLGLPDPSSRMPLIVGGLIVLFVAIFAGAYFLGARGAANAKQTPVLKLDAQQPQQQQAAPPNQPPKEEDNQPPQTASKPAVEDDRSLLDILTRKCADGTAILSAWADPRAKSVMITFAETGDEKALMARLARDAFAALPDANLVTLRGIRQGRVDYMADVAREKMAETQAPEWQQQHANEPDLWIDYVLQNLMRGAPTASGQNPAGTDAAGTTGATGSNPPTDGGTTTAGGGQ